MTNYEGTSYNAYDGHAILRSGYSYDANGNLKSRAGRTLSWNHENRFSGISGAGLPTENYLYDDKAGAPWARVKKTAGSTSTYYPFAHYAPRGFPTGWLYRHQVLLLWRPAPPRGFPHERKAAPSPTCTRTGCPLGVGVQY